MLVEHKRYKLFLVEEDDEDRERVLSAKVNSFELKHEPEFDNIYTDMVVSPIHRYMVKDNVTLVLNLEPEPSGVVFRVEDFSKEEEE